MKITIETQDQQTFTVTVSDDNDSDDAQEMPNESEPQTFNSVDDVIQFVQEELSEESPDDMWASESQSRDKMTGIRKPGNQPAMPSKPTPKMTM